MWNCKTTRRAISAHLSDDWKLAHMLPMFEKDHGRVCEPQSRHLSPMSIHGKLIYCRIRSRIITYELFWEAGVVKDHPMYIIHLNDHICIPSVHQNRVLLMPCSETLCVWLPTTLNYLVLEFCHVLRVCRIFFDCKLEGRGVKKVTMQQFLI